MYLAGREARASGAISGETDVFFQTDTKRRCDNNTYKEITDSLNLMCLVGGRSR